MKTKRVSAIAVVTVAILGVAWIAVWISAATSNGSTPNAAPARTQQGHVDSITNEPPVMTDREKADFARLIAVVDVTASEPFLMPPNDSRNVPAGVGVDYTLFTLEIQKAVKTDEKVGERIVVRQLGTPGDHAEDGPSAYLKVGGHYFVIVGYYDSVDFFPDSDFFIEITSPEQEAELVAKYTNLLSATPVAGDDNKLTSTSAAEVEPTPTAESVVNTPESTMVVVPPPSGSPVVESDLESPTPD